MEPVDVGEACLRVIPSSDYRAVGKIWRAFWLLNICHRHHLKLTFIDVPRQSNLCRHMWSWHILHHIKSPGFVSFISPIDYIICPSAAGILICLLFLSALTPTACLWHFIPFVAALTNLLCSSLLLPSSFHPPRWETIYARLLEN